MLDNAPRILRIFGIDIRVHPSWLLVFVLVTWSLAVGYFPSSIPGLGATTAWTLGVVAALLFFASVLLHELSHSIVARVRGIGVESITLFVFGGVSSLTGEAASATSEFAVAIVGPLTSLVIAGLALGASALVDAATARGLPLVTGVLGYVGLVNGLVGVFNLVPGFPLDGGRVLRAAVWRASGDVRLATRVAAGAGRLVAWLFILWGVFQVLTGDLLNGIWIAAIGWFLDTAAASSSHQLAIDQAVARVRVGEILRRRSDRVAPEQSVEDAVRSTLLPHNLLSVPVVDGQVVGILNVDDVRRVPPELRGRTPVRLIMRPAARFTAVSPAASLRDALRVLAAAGGGEVVPVVEDGRLVGLLTRAEIMHAIRLRQELGEAA